MAAKKYTKDELKAAVTKWADETGLPAEDRPAFLKSLDHDGFATKLGEAILMRSDYSRVMDTEVTPAKKLYDDEYQKLVNVWYPGIKTAYEKAEAAKTTAETRVKQYEKQFGSIDEAEDIGGGKVRTESGDVIRKADFDKILAAEKEAMRTEIMGQSVGITLKIQELAYDHYKEFKEPLDTRPLVAKVKTNRDKGDQNYDLDAAYKEEWGPKIDEKRQTERKQELDNAVSAARVDERSKLRSSAAAVVDEESVGPFFQAQIANAKGKPMTPEQLEADFVRGMNEGEQAAAGSSSG